MGRSGWVLSGIMLSLLLLIAFLIGLSAGAASQGDIIFTQDTLSAWVSALATVCIAALTIFLARETWALRQTQLSQMETIRKDSIKPCIALYLQKSSAGFNLPNVHIINNGKGVAQNVRFKFSNRNSHSLEVYEHITEYFFKLSMIKNGISSLGSGESRVSFVFSFYDLRSKLNENAFTYSAEIEIDYEDHEGAKFSTRIILDFSEYKGSSEIGGNEIRKISSSLDKIQKDINHFSTGFKKLKADIYTSDDRVGEAEALKKRREERSNGN